MRAFFLASALLVFASLAGAQNIPPALVALRDPYFKSLGQLRTAREQHAVPIANAYVVSLDRLQKQAPSDAVLASVVARERDRLGAKREPSENERRTMPPAVAQLAARYDADLERSNAPYL